MGEDTIISSLVEPMDTNCLEENQKRCIQYTYYTTAMV